MPRRTKEIRVINKKKQKNIKDLDKNTKLQLKRTMNKLKQL